MTSKEQEVKTDSIIVYAIVFERYQGMAILSGRGRQVSKSKEILTRVLEVPVLLLQAVDKPKHIHSYRKYTLFREISCFTCEERCST